MKLRVSILWMAMLMLLAPGAWAAEPDLDSKARALDRGVPTAERSAFNNKFGIMPTVTTTTTTGGMTTTTNFNYNMLPPGQALVLWSLCKGDAVCATTDWNLHKAGKGWGEIAGNKLGPAIKLVTDAHRDLAAKAGREKTSRDEGATSSERPEHPSRGMGRPGR